MLFEVRAAKFLMTLALEEGLGQLQIFKDYKPVICWMEGSLQTSNLNLQGVSHIC